MSEAGDPTGTGAAPADRAGRLAPSSDVLAAIEAAVAAAWPRPRPAGPTGPSHTAPWRFSGRWWAAPLPLRRDRP